MTTRAETNQGDDSRSNKPRKGWRVHSIESVKGVKGGRIVERKVVGYKNRGAGRRVGSMRKSIWMVQQQGTTKEGIKRPWAIDAV